jgi:hypothetical protein
MTKEVRRLFLRKVVGWTGWEAAIRRSTIKEAGVRTTESSLGNADGARERDRALERTLRDALALAVSKKVADQALRQARNKAHDGGRHDLRRVAGHLAGYGTLLTYIWHQRRTQKQSAG